MVPITLQTYRLTFLVLGGELERDGKLEQDNRQAITLCEHIQEASSLADVLLGVLQALDRSGRLALRRGSPGCMSKDWFALIANSKSGFSTASLQRFAISGSN
jgi:hypothetical protein